MVWTREGRRGVEQLHPWFLLVLAVAILVGCSNASGDDEAAADDAAPPSEGATESTGTAQAAPAPAATDAEPEVDAGPLDVMEIGQSFTEDFTGSESIARFDFHMFHRDDHLVNQSEWPGDHVLTGPNDLCGPPDEKRVVARGERANDFNDEWIYRCVPGGDLGKAHVMTSIGDTSGYSIGAFSPRAVFPSIREVRWDVNQTDLGDRQWTEVSIIPEANFDLNRLPCTDDVPCDTTSHDEIGSVGIQWAGQRVRRINTPEMPNGYMEAGGGLGYRCETCPYAPSRRFGEGFGANDPALTSIQIRRENYFRDNGDNTLTWGFQLEDGSFEEFTVPGSFPSGPLRVAFKDHNYTPMKAPATLLPETTFTWHWDNIVIHTTDVGGAS